MIIEYQIFVEENTLLLRYKGDFCIERYKGQVLDMINKPEWKLIDKIFVDLRFVKITTNDKNLIDELTSFQNKHIDKKYFSIQLVKGFLLTALMHLYQLGKKANNSKSVYCSTVKKSIKLLDWNISEDDFEEILNNLEHTF